MPHVSTLSPSWIADLFTRSQRTDINIDNGKQCSHKKPPQLVTALRTNPTMRDKVIDDLIDLADNKCGHSNWLVRTSSQLVANVIPNVQRQTISELLEPVSEDLQPFVDQAYASRQSIPKHFDEHSQDIAPHLMQNLDSYCRSKIGGRFEPIYTHLYSRIRPHLTPLAEDTALDLGLIIEREIEHGTESNQPETNADQATPAKQTTTTLNLEQANDYWSDPIWWP